MSLYVVINADVILGLWRWIPAWMSHKTILLPRKALKQKYLKVSKYLPKPQKINTPQKKFILGKESFFLAQPVAYRCRDPKTIIRILHLKDLWKTNWDPVPASVNLNLPRGSGLVQFHRVQYQCYQLSHLQQGTSSLINKVESICILRMEANSTI